MDLFKGIIPSDYSKIPVIPDMFEQFTVFVEPRHTGHLILGHVAQRQVEKKFGFMLLHPTDTVPCLLCHFVEPCITVHGTTITPAVGTDGRHAIAVKIGILEPSCFAGDNALQVRRIHARGFETGIPQEGFTYHAHIAVGPGHPGNRFDRVIAVL